MTDVTQQYDGHVCACEATAPAEQGSALLLRSRKEHGVDRSVGPELALVPWRAAHAVEGKSSAYQACNNLQHCYVPAGQCIERHGFILARFRLITCDEHLAGHVLLLTAHAGGMIGPNPYNGLEKAQRSLRHTLCTCVFSAISSITGLVGPERNQYLPSRFNASKTSITVAVWRFPCSVMMIMSCNTFLKKTLRAIIASDGTSELILFTPAAGKHPHCLSLSFTSKISENAS